MVELQWRFQPVITSVKLFTRSRAFVDSNPGSTVFPIEGQGDLPRLGTFDFLERNCLGLNYVVMLFPFGSAGGVM